MDNLVFWGATAALTLAAAGLLVQALRRGAALSEGAQDYDVQVYRDQLAEVDRDLARGVLEPEDAERARTEISRRILAADAGRAALGSGPRGGVTWLAAGFAVLVIAVGGYATYLTLGAPGYGDFSLKARVEAAAELRANRPSQAEAEAEAPAVPPSTDARLVGLVAQLRDVLRARPDDLEGHQLLVRYEGALGNYAAAYAAQERVIALKGADALAADYGALAELMILAAAGRVTPEADVPLQQALARDPDLSSARYYTGLMHLQTGRPDLTFRLWAQLLEEGPEEAPWIAPIRAQILDLAQLAGVRYTPPSADAPRGPSQADIAAAADLTPQERMEMIRGMVDRLSTKLATDGGTAQEWAQLLRSLVVIGDVDQAERVWENAKEVFGEDSADILPVLRAAQRAGFTQ